MSRRIPCRNSSVKTPRCGSECLKATQIPTKAVSVHCALPPPPPSPRSPLHHYRTPDPTRWPRGPARGPSAPLCGAGTTSRAPPRAPPAPGVWVARGPWCHRGSCALLGCCESPVGSLRVGAVQGEQVPYPKENRKDVTEASAAELLTWSRKGEFTLRPRVYSECFIDTQTESVH